MDPRNTLSDPKAPIQATCHCGAITVTAPNHPKNPINECQCTICRRYGAAWAYYDASEITIDKQSETEMGKYCWGFKTCNFQWCQGCGCLMFWWPEDGKGQMGLNSRMVEPDALKGVERRVTFEDLFTEAKGE